MCNLYHNLVVLNLFLKHRHKQKKNGNFVVTHVLPDLKDFKVKSIYLSIMFCVSSNAIKNIGHFYFISVNGFFAKMLEYWHSLCHIEFLKCVLRNE